ncbi:MAG: hypothetical protein R2940_08195 [Syntrophotaleaceae bacterium]
MELPEGWTGRKRFFIGTGSFGLLAFLMMFLALACEVAHAADDRYAWERGAIRLGGVYAGFESDLGLRIGNRKGVKLNGEDLLGLEESQFDFQADAYLRLGRQLRHRLDFTYVRHHRESDERLNREISVGGFVILPENRVKTELDLELYRLLYSYSLIQDDRVSLGTGLGTYVVPVRYGFEIGSRSGNGPEIDDVIVPFPALFVRTEFQITPKFNFFSNIAAMYLEFSGYEGTLIDFRIGLEYDLFKNLGIGLAYESLNVSVDTDEEGEFLEIDFPGDLDFNRQGILLFAKVSF